MDETSQHKLVNVYTGCVCQIENQRKPQAIWTLNKIALICNRSISVTMATKDI